MTLRFHYLALAVAVCVALGGCGSKKQYKYRIAVIPKGRTHEHWQSVHRGADRAAEDLQKQGIAVEVLWDGPTRESDASDQIQIVDRMLAQRINGLVLAPQHSKQMIPPVERARDDDVPVVIIDSNLDRAALDKNPDLILKYVATDNYNGGRLAAQHLLKVLDREGRKDPNLILLRYAPGSESTEQREQGFLDVIEAEKKKGKAITLLSTDKYAGATVDDAEKVAGPLLRSFEKTRVDGIFAVNESSATGLLNVMVAQELNKKIHVVAFDSSKPLLRWLRDGDVDGLVIQDPYRMGYLGVWTIVQHLEGYDVSPGGKTLSTGEYLVTRENMEDEETKNKFDPEFQKKRTIKVENYKKK
jgi:ribose transport system substrate-binding protein